MALQTFDIIPHSVFLVSQLQISERNNEALVVRSLCAGFPERKRLHDVHVHLHRIARLDLHVGQLEKHRNRYKLLLQEPE